jgi:7-keto-8-aminopelargonate synthetase-like enzyme
LCGGQDEALRFARACQRQGLYVQAILPPVVPAGSARLRLAVSAAHRPQDLRDAVATMARVADDAGVSPQVAVPSPPLEVLEA